MEKQEYFKATSNGSTLFRTRTRPGIEVGALETNLIDVKELQGKMMQIEAQNKRLELRLDELEGKSESANINVSGSSLSLLANRRDI